MDGLKGWDINSLKGFGKVWEGLRMFGVIIYSVVSFLILSVLLF